MPNKAVAAGGTTALAGAMATLLFSLLGHPADPGTEGAVTTIIAAGLTFAATYFTKPEGV